MQKTALDAGSLKTAAAASPLRCQQVTSSACFTESHKTGINIAASLHFLAALPNSHYFEYCVEQGALRQSLTKQRFLVIDGDITVPEEPGLGVDLDEKVVEKYRVC